MNCEREMKNFEKADYTGTAFLRNVLLCLSVIILFCFSLFSGFAFAAGCANPGKDGVGTPSGVVNTYYPGTASVSAGATSIPVGASSGSGTAIAAGDLLLIIQMQDADIAYSNDSNYGSGSGTGSGYTNLNQTGYYEYAVAAGAVAGGFVSITGGLAYNYRYRAASGTNGQSTYQVIRVPQYSSATIAGTLSALSWNGSVGGIVAIDVAGTLTINGTVTANGAGFRGGFGRSLGGGAGANTDYRTSYLVNVNGSKAEGIAGSPYYMNMPATFDGAPAVATTYGSGYPDGTTTNASYARGAPGNGGGGGTDGSPSDNTQNSGGGGGGNYAAGAVGGNSWNSNLAVGGEGGGAVSGLAFNRIVMGGGGGAGTTNNGTGDNTTYTNPPGLACSLTTGACSSGAPGGGIVILRANLMAGAGTITANGGDGYNVQNDSGGGGGAGGAVVLYTYAGGSATASVNGGNGGNAWRSQAEGTFPGNCHGPGGGGSGGFIAYSPSSLGVAMSYSAGISGTTTSAQISYGSGSSSGGYSTFNSPNPPGVLPGSECVPNLSTSTKTVVDTTSAGAYAAGDTLQYTITLTETRGLAATGVSVTDTINTNLINLTIISCPSGATCSYTAPTLSVSGISVPANGSVTIVYNATISGSATPGTTITNTATITNPGGAGATPAAPMVTVTGTVAGTGNKPLYLYRDTITTGHLNRARPTVAATYVEINANTTISWALSPVLQSAVTINGAAGTTIPVQLWLSTNNTRTYALNPITLTCGATTLGTLTTGTAALTNGAAAALFTFNLPHTTTQTCAAGSALTLSITNTNAAGNGHYVYVYPAPAAGEYSNVNILSQNVINVNSIGLYSAAYPSAAALTSVAPGQTVYIRATISDPFGSYDITGASLTLTDSGSPSTLRLNAVTMPQVYDSGAATKIYEYQYTVPATGVPAGNWSIKVTAAEGTEGTVTDTGYVTMPLVIPPVLNVVKSVSPNPSINPGQVLTYTIVITNTGNGTATNVIATDSVPTYTTYVANSTLLNGITVAGDGSTLPLIAGLLVDNNSGRSAGVAATGVLPAGSSATITFQTTAK